jgi:hypothetical protein
MRTWPRHRWTEGLSSAWRAVPCPDHGRADPVRVAGPAALAARPVRSAKTAQVGLAAPDARLGPRPGAGRGSGNMPAARAGSPRDDRHPVAELACYGQDLLGDLPFCLRRDPGGEGSNAHGRDHLLVLVRVRTLSSAPGRSSRRAPLELLVGAGAAEPMDEACAVDGGSVRHVEALAAVPGDEPVVAAPLVLELPLLIGAGGGWPPAPHAWTGP